MINESDIPLIEKALGKTLYEGQKSYLLDKGEYWYDGDRQTGKTFVFCIKLALSEGKPLDSSKPERFCDSDFGPPGNKIHYARSYFIIMFRDVWYALKEAGFKVRPLYNAKKIAFIE